METTILVFIAGGNASDKTQIVQMFADVLKEKGIAFIASNNGDCFGNNGTSDATIKGVVTITTVFNKVENNAG